MIPPPLFHKTSLAYSLPSHFISHSIIPLLIFYRKKKFCTQFGISTLFSLSLARNRLLTRFNQLLRRSSTDGIYYLFHFLYQIIGFNFCSCCCRPAFNSSLPFIFILYFARNHFVFIVFSQFFGNAHEAKPFPR